MDTCSILGANIALSSKEEIINYIDNKIGELKGEYISILNSYTTTIFYEKFEMRRAKGEAAFEIAGDKKLAKFIEKNINGNFSETTNLELMDNIFKISEEKGYTQFLYGSNESNLKELTRIIKRRYPKLRIIGSYSPDKENKSKGEEEYVVGIINTIKPDFMWVGLGVIEEDYWMFEHKNKIEAFMIGISDGLEDYLGRKVKFKEKIKRKIRSIKYDIKCQYYLSKIRIKN